MQTDHEAKPASATRRLRLERTWEECVVERPDRDTMEWNPIPSEELTRGISASVGRNRRVSNSLRGPLTGLAIREPIARTERS
jgi:hypothetical protein